MVSLTVPLDNSFDARLKQFSWINWSDVGREEVLKKEIFEGYLKEHKLSKEDEAFCESIDWHPVDELPLKEEFVKKLKQIEAGPHSQYMTPEELRKWLHNL